MEGKLQMKQIFNIATIFGLLLLAGLAVLGYSQGVFHSQETFKEFILSCGIFGSLIFTVFQAVQVVLPILPGSIGCVVGVLAFGPVWGFVYNYIGICLGSIAAFLLAKRYGQGFVKKITNPKQYEKYSAWLNKGKKFEHFFATAIALPVAPDDFLCFLAGLSKMTLKKFTVIIILGKPVALFLYSLALTAGVEWLLKLL